MHCLRLVNTKQERRAAGRGNAVWVDGYRVRVRAKRNTANLPNSWDDIARSDYTNRSWKRHRKTQYKPK